MPLQRLSIDSVTPVTAGNTSTIVVTSNNQRTYVRTLILHAAALGSSTPNAPVNVQVHVVPNSGGAQGTASASTRIARINMAADDTFFLEPEYPIILGSNGDCIKVHNEGTTNSGAASYSVNVLAMGDRET